VRRLFGPKTTITAPDGAEWELYVSRFRGPRWEARDYDSPTDALTSNWNPSGGIVLLLLEIPLFLYNCILVPAVTYVFSLPVAAVRSRRSRTWTVEALCWWPHEQRFRWTVQSGDRARVAAEIASGIAEGRWAQPAGAVFHGQEVR
jgi:hypothetical protein